MSAPPTEPAPPPHPSLPPQALIGFGLILGLGMIALALAVSLLGDVNSGDWYPRAGWPGEVALGLALGSGGAVLAWGLTRRIAALRSIEHLLLRMLDMRKMRYHHTVMIGLVAGLPEEMLFRGAILPGLGRSHLVMGWLLSALIFGALHAVTRAYFVYATLAGLLLGAVAIWRGDLWAATTAHAALDALLMMLMLRDWRGQSRDVPTAGR